MQQGSNTRDRDQTADFLSRDSLLFAFTVRLPRVQTTNFKERETQPLHRTKSLELKTMLRSHFLLGLADSIYPFMK